MKILLLTDVPPNDRYSGSLMTKHLCELLPAHSIACFSVLNKHLSFLKELCTDENIDFAFCRKPNEAHLPLEYLTYLKEKYIEEYIVPRLIDEVVAFGKKQKVDRIWAILQGQTIIRMSVKVARKLQVPLYTQVWDHPLWWVEDCKLDRWSKRSILKQFDEAIFNSRCCAVASYEMEKNFVEKYNTKAIPIIASINEDYIKPIEKYEIKGKNELVIGMAGQIYAKREWFALLQTLDRLGWRIGKQNIKVRFWGRKDALTTENRSNIEYMGYRSQPEVIEMLSECDILYCPYFSEKEYEIIAKTSFPSKLTTYLAAGKPIFFHGPSYASPAIFLEEHDAGIVCTSLNIDEIEQALTHMVENQDRCNQVINNGHNILVKEFTMASLKEKFLQFIRA